MFLLVAMGPPGGGRTVISERLQSRFNLFNMTFPQVSVQVQIPLRRLSVAEASSQGSFSESGGLQTTKRECHGKVLRLLRDGCDKVCT